MSEERCWTVWVGGTEANDYYLTKEEAHFLAQLFIDDDYDDVLVEKVSLQKK